MIGEINTLAIDRSVPSQRAASRKASAQERRRTTHARLELAHDADHSRRIVTRLPTAITTNPAATTGHGPPHHPSKADAQQPKISRPFDAV
jgi:hypothetical protein